MFKDPSNEISHEEVIERIEEAQQAGEAVLNNEGRWEIDTKEGSQDSEEVTPEIKELEQLVDEAIKDFTNESNDEIDEETIKEFEELNKMPISNEKILESILDVNKSYISAKREELIIDNKIFRAIENNEKIVTELNGKHNRTIYILHMLFTLVGIGIGANLETFKPFMKELFNFAIKLV
jgi:vacuolar-type H+-ATPase subunit H